MLYAIRDVLACKYLVVLDVNAYYPYLILSFPSISALDLLKAGPLFYGVTWFIQFITGADVFLLLKIAGPVIYGILSASFLVFLVKFLKLSLQKATFGTVLLILQPIALRISWDLFRNELGLAFGLVALASVKTNWRQKYVIAGSLGVLAVLAHPLAAVLMFVGKGFWYEPTLGAITAWTGLASFSFVLSPILSIPIYWRWEILLIFPFAIYSLKGLDKLGLFKPNRAFARKILIGFFLLLALGYSTGAFSYMGSYGVNSFAPGTMVQGSIRQDQIGASLSSLTWLKSYAPANSILLSDERFISYTYLTIGNSLRMVVQPGGPPSQNAVSQALAFRPSHLFVIWDSSLSLDGFSTVHSENGISILQYGS